MNNSRQRPTTHITSGKPLLLHFLSLSSSSSSHRVHSRGPCGQFSPDADEQSWRTVADLNGEDGQGEGSTLVSFFSVRFDQLFGEQDANVARVPLADQVNARCEMCCHRGRFGLSLSGGWFRKRIARFRGLKYPLLLGFYFIPPTHVLWQAQIKKFAVALLHCPWFNFTQIVTRSSDGQYPLCLQIWSPIV